MCGPENCPRRAGTLRFVGEAIPRDTEFLPLTLNSQRNESLTHRLFLKMQGRMRRQVKGMEKKRKGEGDKDEEGGCDKDNEREVSGQREQGGDGEGNQEEEKGKRRQKRGIKGERRGNRGGRLRWICNLFFLKLGCRFAVIAMFAVLSSVLFCMPGTFHNLKKEEKGEERIRIKRQEPRACRSTGAWFRFFSTSTATPTAFWVLRHSSWGGFCSSWKRGRPPHWVCIFKMLGTLMVLLSQFPEEWPMLSRATSSKQKPRASCVADRVLGLWLGVRPLRWET